MEKTTLLPPTMATYWKKRQATWSRLQRELGDRGGSRFASAEEGQLVLQVKTLTGNVWRIRANPSDTIEALKFKVWERHGVPTSTYLKATLCVVQLYCVVMG
jgi:hypothetical protein